MLDQPAGVSGEPPRFCAMHRTVDLPRPTTEACASVVAECLLDLGLGVHDERSVLGDGLADRTTLQHQAFDRCVAGAHLDIGIATNHRAGRSTELMIADRQCVTLEEI